MRENSTLLAFYFNWLRQLFDNLHLRGLNWPAGWFVPGELVSMFGLGLGTLGFERLRPGGIACGVQSLVAIGDFHRSFRAHAQVGIASRQHGDVFFSQHCDS
jgi:hypothetical protein